MNIRTWFALTLFAGSVLASSIVVFVLSRPHDVADEGRAGSVPTETRPYPTITFGSARVQVDVADDPVERKRGLSGRTSLREGEGLLFIFERSDLHGFWMPDMNFSIDIVWLDEELRVVTVISDIYPNTYPEVFYPSAPAKYVLEVPAGYALRNGITEGSIGILAE